jgi:site-specific recombinase XerC
MRALKKADLRKKSEGDDVHYELHPHCFRKYFHTNMLASGVDRGIVEGFEGHKFALDSSYLRATDEQLLEQYKKGLDAITFLSNNAPLKSKVEETREELEKVKEKIKRGDSKETLLEAVEEYEKKLMEKWLTSNQAGGKMRMMFMPTELDQVRWIKAILTNPSSTALDVYKAQRRFDKIIEEAE